MQAGSGVQGPGPGAELIPECLASHIMHFVRKISCELSRRPNAYCDRESTVGSNESSGYGVVNGRWI